MRRRTCSGAKLARIDPLAGFDDGLIDEGAADDRFRLGFHEGGFGRRIGRGLYSARP